MAADIICRKDALAIGRIRYFTGKPCKHGHIAERYVSSNECTTCCIVRERDKYHTNPQAERDRVAKYYSLNKEKIKASRPPRTRKPRTTIILSPEERRQYHCNRVKEWYRKNKEKKFATAHKRRAFIRSGDKGKYTAQEITNLLKKQKFKCAEITCAKSIKKIFHRDHIMPIALGGSNVIANIQLLCPTCNLRKFSKHPIVWAQQNGRLL